jgi:hypothetical protein
MNWAEGQEWERQWHGNCANSLNEEIKQLGYAEKMGLELVRTPKTPYNFDLRGASVLDIGGGPASLLLKCRNYLAAKVVDPCDYPKWVKARYANCNIGFLQVKGEDISETGWDEAWIYNCLQHTEDFRRVIANARRAAKLIRIFEWVDTPITPGHNHTLRAAELDELLGGQGKVEVFNGQRGLGGPAYYGIFPARRAV